MTHCLAPAGSIFGAPVVNTPPRPKHPAPKAQLASAWRSRFVAEWHYPCARGPPMAGGSEARGGGAMAESDTERPSIETETTHISVREDGVVVVRLKPGAEVTLEAARANHSATERLVGDREFVTNVKSLK